MSFAAKPTDTHRFFEKLGQLGILERLYTQNIDCLENRLQLRIWSGKAVDEGTEDNPIRVVPVHGSLRQLRCSLCQNISNFTDIVSKNFEAGEKLDCPKCKKPKFAEIRGRSSRRFKENRSIGFLRPNVVLYGEDTTDGDLISAFAKEDIKKDIGMVLVVGTSLKVTGLTKLLNDIKASFQEGESKGKRKVIFIYLNKECANSAWKNIFDYQLLGDCDSWLNYFDAKYFSPPLSFREPETEIETPRQPLPSSRPVRVPNSYNIPDSYEPLLKTRINPEPNQKKMMKLEDIKKFFHETEKVQKVEHIIAKVFAKCPNSITAATRAVLCLPFRFSTHQSWNGLDRRFFCNANRNTYLWNILKQNLIKARFVSVKKSSVKRNFF